MSKGLMGSDYEDRLRSFVEGKRLGRLAKAVRDRADAVCDACGSALPRTLFGLKDTVSDRCYFVGQNCLARLLETGLVARARFRQSAETAYRREMELRRNGEHPERPQPHAGAGAAGNPPIRTCDFSRLRRTVLIVSSDSHVEALARLADGRRTVSARASEPRWRREWARQDGAMILEPVCRPRRAALAMCVLKAYGQALALWRKGDGLDGGNGGRRPLKG